MQRFKSLAFLRLLREIQIILGFLSIFSAYFWWNMPEDSLHLTSCHAEEVISASVSPPPAFRAVKWRRSALEDLLPWSCQFPVIAITAHQKGLRTECTVQHSWRQVRLLGLMNDWKSLFPLICICDILKTKKNVSALRIIKRKAPLLTIKKKKDYLDVLQQLWFFRQKG